MAASTVEGFSFYYDLEMLKYRNFARWFIIGFGTHLGTPLHHIVFQDKHILFRDNGWQLVPSSPEQGDCKAANHDLLDNDQN